MAPSRLSVPDDTADQVDPDYSAPIAAALEQAYALARSRTAAFAEPLLLPLRHERMTTMQRLRLLYLLGMATTDSQQYTQALGFADEALDLAIDHDDLESITTLAYLGANALHNLQRFTIAARYYNVALDALRSQTNPASTDATMEFDLVRGLATEEFLCARYPATEHHLRAARRIVLPGAGHERRIGGLEWMWAMIYRWRGRSGAALSHAMNAYDLYNNRSNPVEFARLRILVSETLLDLAAEDPTGIARRDSLVALTEPHLLHALASAGVTDDQAGEGLARLAYARYLRITGSSGDALAQIDLVESIALEQSDLPLLAQTHTTRGDTFATRGEPEAAQACYRAALDALRGNDARAYAMPAQRALRRAAEMDDTP